MGNQLLQKLAQAVIGILALVVLVAPTPAHAQGGLVACVNVGNSSFADYYTYEVGTSSYAGQVGLTDATVFPYGDGQYGKMSFNLRDFGIDTFNTPNVALYSVKFGVYPDLVINTDVFTFVTPYANGVAGRITQHGWVANLINESREWTDVYPEYPLADSVSIAVFMEGASDLADYFLLYEICVYPVSVPTATPQNTTTPLPSRTPTVTRTPTPQTFTPAPTNTVAATNTPAPTNTPNATTSDTPPPSTIVFSTLGPVRFVTVPPPAACGDPINPCGSLPFPVPGFPSPNFPSPTPIASYSPAPSGTPGATATGIATGEFLATLETGLGDRVYSGSDRYDGLDGEPLDLENTAAQLGQTIVDGFNYFRTLQEYYAGRSWNVVSFLFMVLIFVVLFILFTFLIRVLIFILRLIRIVP